MLGEMDDSQTTDGSMGLSDMQEMQRYCVCCLLFNQESLEDVRERGRCFGWASSSIQAERGGRMRRNIQHNDGRSQFAHGRCGQAYMRTCEGTVLGTEYSHLAMDVCLSWAFAAA